MNSDWNTYQDYHAWLIRAYKEYSIMPNEIKCSNTAVRRYYWNRAFRSEIKRIENILNYMSYVSRETIGGVLIMQTNSMQSNLRAAK
jgi:phosphoserine aminotransferase